MSVWYLELDDEITDAVARVRAAKDDRVVLVVPPGSRIGTGRINFRLLAREALGRGIGIAVVSGDVQVRALATSAGLAAFRTVSETETVAKERLVPREGSDVPVDEPPVVGPTTSTAPGPGGATSVVASSATSVHGRSAPAATRRRSVPRRAKVAGASAALAVTLTGGLLYGAYVTIPRATVLLTQKAHAIAATSLPITVKPDQASDPLTGTVRGTWLPVRVQQDVEVTATGQGKDEGERARGTVTFTNHHTQNTVRVPDQTIVSTPSGVEFQTQGSVVVPPMGSADVPIAAASVGQAGNVDPGAVSVMPPDLAGRMNGGTVTNKAATSGGDITHPPMITEQDYETALATLTQQLREALPAQAQNPDGLPADGIVFPSTVREGTVDPVPPEGEIVDQLEPTMTLSGTMEGSVLTASGNDLRSTVTQMLKNRNEGAVFVAGSIEVQPHDPVVNPDGTVSYPATASGSAYDVALDTTDLTKQIAGKTIPEVHDILDRYGEVTVQLSPDFMPSLPDDPNRIDLKLTPIGTPKPPTGTPKS